MSPPSRLGYHLPDQLRWLDDNRSAGYMPCGQLVGVTLRQCADLMEAQQARLAAVREVIERGYRGVDKNELCPHERYGFEDCIACYDEALIAALESDSGSDPQGENSRSEVEGEASQSGAEGNRPPLSTERTPHV